MLITLASLLHDIGKFYQRTNFVVDISKYYHYLVRHKNKFQYHHAAYTALFIDTYIMPDYRDFLELASSHHLKKWTYVKRADIIASSHDRRDSEYFDENNDNLITTRLYSIFNEIKINNVEKFQYVKIDTLDNFKGFFDKKIINYEESIKNYQNLFLKMCKQILFLGYNTYESLHHFLYPIIKNYTFAIPANTYNSTFPTVGLFDHLKLTTAIANCLKNTNQKSPFVIVKFKIQNISKYIYYDNDLDNINKRSLYVNLLSDFICYKIIDDFNLTYENVLYAMSGQGRILLYNIKNIKDKLSKVYSQIVNFVKIKHQGIIDFVLSYDIYDDKKLMNGKFKNQINEHEKYIFDYKYEKNYEKFNDINFDIGFKSFAFDYHNNNSNGKVIDLSPLGRILLDTQEMIDNTYYFTVNHHQIGEVKYYSNYNNLKTKSNLVLLMFDIDKLRIIFKSGIENNKQSISKFLTLSRYLEIFFGKIVFEIVQEFNDINLIYSGGDNIIIIIPKTNAAKVIEQIVNYFYDYTGKNKAICLKYYYQEIDDSIYKTYQEVKKNLKKEVSNI